VEWQTVNSFMDRPLWRLIDRLLGGSARDGAAHGWELLPLSAFADH
jgi:hypothetical protein